jgi:hypothetical protein
MRAKRERPITWWNPAVQMRPVLNSSSFAPFLTLARRTCLHSASSVHAVRISCRVIAVFVFRKPLFINKLYCIYVCYMNITLYIVLGIHVTALGLGTYYPWIQGHYCICKQEVECQSWHIHVAGFLTHLRASVLFNSPIILEEKKR